MNLLFVVHRYYPFPGGSEYFVQAMAEEAVGRGHSVTVLAGEHQGDQNGVTVTEQAQVLMQPWDLVIVHGGDVSVQNFVLSNATRIPSPILYMLILPSHSQVCVQAMKDCAYLGWSTPEDLAHIKQYGYEHKAVRIRHGIKLEESLGALGFKAKYNIPSDKAMLLSCGGYWPNKQMKELTNLFINAGIDDAVLVTTGYDNRMNLMPDPVPGKVIPLLIDDKADVLSAIREADIYYMHSSQEGFGLVILEAMLNRTAWVARDIAGAAMLKQFGKTYSTDDELRHIMANCMPTIEELDNAQEYVLKNHLIKHTVDDIMSIIKK